MTIPADLRLQVPFVGTTQLSCYCIFVSMVSKALTANLLAGLARLKHSSEYARSILTQDRGPRVKTIHASVGSSEAPVAYEPAFGAGCVAVREVGGFEAIAVADFVHLPCIAKSAMITPTFLQIYR